jgi:hypothetical protein
MDSEVVVRRFDAVHEAEMMAGYLRANGVPARLDDAVVVGMNPLLSLALGGIKLYVPRESAEEAARLLHEIDTAEVEPGEGPIPYRSRAPTGNPMPTADRVAGRALLWALAGATVVPIVGALYSLYLTGSLRGAELSERGRGERRFAMIIDALVLGGALYLFAFR